MSLKIIKIKLRFSDSHEDNIYWVRIWCTDKNIERAKTNDVVL